MKSMGRMGRPGLAVTAALLIALAAGGAARAQDMDQGEARVRSRSDVQMRVDSGPATNSERLARLAAPLSGALTPIKQCYAKVLEDRPTVEGELNLTVALPERGRVRVKVAHDGVDDATVVHCALTAVRRTDFGDAPRPANALVRLAFTHSAAAGVRETRKKEAQARHGAVHVNDDGHPEASFATPRGQVAFTVEGAEPKDADRVSAAQAGLRAAIPGLLDCRRHAGKRDQSPAGEIDLTLQVARNGRARARATHSTVHERRAASCVVRAVTRTRFDRAAVGRLSVKVRFAPYAHDEGDDE